MPFLLASRARGSQTQRSGVRRRTLLARHTLQVGLLRGVAFEHAFWHRQLSSSCTQRCAARPIRMAPQGLGPIADGSGRRAFIGPTEPIFTQGLAGIFSLGWCWTMAKAEPGGRGGGCAAGEAFQAMRKRLGAPEAREEAAPLAPHTARADGDAVFSASWRQNGSKQSGCGEGAVREPELYGREGV